jgi:hypothetical protein
VALRDDEAHVHASPWQTRQVFIVGDLACVWNVVGAAGVFLVAGVALGSFPLISDFFSCELKSAMGQ